MPDGELGRRAFLATAMGTTVSASVSTTSTAAPSAMMPAGIAMSLSDFAATIRSAIKSQRIGTPLFVRLTIAGIAEADGSALLSRLVPIINQWLDQDKPVQHQLAGVGHRPLMLAYPNGASAIIALAVAPAPLSPIDVLVVGNHGSIQHDFGNGVIGPMMLEWQSAVSDTVIAEQLHQGAP